MLPRITEFVHNDFPIVADPEQVTRKAFDIFQVFLIDKDGVMRTLLPGEKEARARLDVLIGELARLEGVEPPPFEWADENVVVAEDEAPAPAPDRASDLLSVKWMWSHNRIWPGDAFKLAYVAEIPAGFHVYGANEFKMTPFRIEFDLPEGVSLREPVRYPKAQKKTDPFLNVPLDVYEDDIPMPLVYFEASKDLKPGEYTVKARMHFQGCNASVCLPPSVRELEMPLYVVEEGTRRGTVAGANDW